MIPALSLSEHFAALTDPRSPPGRRHPLPAVLNRVAVAILGGARSLEAVAQFTRDRGSSFNATLGFTRRQTPCEATLSNLLRRLDIEAIERVLAAWVASRLDPTQARELALDGKTLRGSADGPLPGVHLPAAYAPDVGTVLQQFRVDAKTRPAT